MLITAMEGMPFDTPKGRMTFRKDDHRALQPMFHYRMKAKTEQQGEWDLMEPVREIPASEPTLPIRSSR